MTLVTYQGIPFDYNNPTVEMINIKDIVYSLSRLNRFVGHSKRAYSVAEHSHLCYLMAKKLGFSIREQLLVLIHDFTESYVGDCPAPLKKLIPEFNVIEERIEKVIYEYIGIAPPTDEEYKKIKTCDLTMLAIEMRDLTNHDYKEYLNEDLEEIVEYIGFEILAYDESSSLKERVNRDNLMGAYAELLSLGASSYSKYKVKFGLKDQEMQEVIEYHSDNESALDNAYQYAKDLYHANPTQDMLEIMDDYGVDEDTAGNLFGYSMSKSIEFYVEKVVG